MTQTKPYLWYILGVVVLLCAVGAWFIFNRGSFLANESEANRSDDVSDAIADLIASGATTTTTKNGAIVELVAEPEGAVPTPPSIERSVPATPDLDASGRALVVAKIDAAEDALKANPKSFIDWIDLGLLRSVVKDYVGAKEAWEYAAILAPNTATPFANLGDLHMHYLTDYPKAEANLKKAIANDASQSARFYRMLYELYTLWKPNTDAPTQALKDGIKKAPNALDLHVLLARHYKQSGKTAESRAAYDVAISVATKAGNAEAAAQLRAERP